MLCDALDEALGKRCELVLAEIDRLLTSRLYEKAPLVITARTREDPGNRLRNLHPYTIQDLNDEAVRTFVQVYCREGDNEKEILVHLERAGLLESGGLGRNPFWLRLIVASGTFQGRKGKILKESVQSLLEREWDEKSAAQRAGWTRLSAKEEQLTETRWALAWLAYRMSEMGVVSLSHDQVVNEILPTWLNQRSSGARLQAADVVGLGRDAQLLVYWPGPLRFRHRLIQEAMTAQLLASDEGLCQNAIAQHAADAGWWETLLMLGHLATDPGTLLGTVLGDGSSKPRLFLGAAILQGIEEPDPTIREQVIFALGGSLAEGVTEGHKAAVTALALIDQEGMAGLLNDLLQNSNDLLQQAALELLPILGDEALMALSLPSLLTILHKGDVGLQDIAIQAVASMGEDARQSALADMPLERRVIIKAALRQIDEPRAGAGVLIRDKQWLPAIAWGGVVPTGTYTVGGDNDAFISFGQKKVPIAQPYQLARYPVTYAQFECFVTAADFNDPRWWAGMPAQEKAFGTVYQLRELSEPAFPYWNHPRERVSWYQAIAFCRWLSDKLEEEIDLPHEHEWEVAARYPDGRFYPWGNTFDAAKTNTTESSLNETTAVGLYPDGRNPTLDLYDMSGNVWEWCRNEYEDPDDIQVDESGHRSALRGGSWDYVQYYARAAFRYYGHPAYRDSFSGFRVVVRRPPSREP